MKTKLFYVLMCLFAFTATNAQVITLIGSGVGGWDSDKVTLTTTDNITYTAIGAVFAPTLDGTVLKCEVKFRQDNAWAINWGSADFPTGTGTQNGANIVVIPGTYDVTFNITTGAYAFVGGTPPSVVKLIGSAVTGGTINMNTPDGINYNLPSNTILLAGTAQFEVDASVVGALAFPSGTATGVNTDVIPVPAGKYTSVTFNKDTGAYSFVAAPIFDSMAIVGAGAGGWPNDPQIDANQMTTSDGIVYKIKNVALTVDNIKFRQNNNWTDPSFGGVGFPLGTSPGGDIGVTAAGTYDCVFNKVTGVYRFNLSSQPPVSLVGDGAGGWPGGSTPYPDPNVMTTTDGENYTLTNITLTAGNVKFRQDYDWTTNWGGTGFPTGSPSGSNLPATAGNWDVTFTRSTGAYSFTTTPLAVTKFDTASFKAYPNPTKSSWSISSGNDDITSVRVYDILGKSVYNKAASSKEVNVNASALSQGVYFARVSTAKGTSSVKLVKE